MHPFPVVHCGLVRLDCSDLYRGYWGGGNGNLPRSAAFLISSNHLIFHKPVRVEEFEAEVAKHHPGQRIQAGTINTG
jgi:hypothetical protein